MAEFSSGSWWAFNNKHYRMNESSMSGLAAPTLTFPPDSHHILTGKYFQLNQSRLICFKTRKYSPVEDKILPKHPLLCGHPVQGSMQGSFSHWLQCGEHESLNLLCYFSWQSWINFYFLQVGHWWQPKSSLVTGGLVDITHKAAGGSKAASSLKIPP